MIWVTTVIPPIERNTKWGIFQPVGSKTYRRLKGCASLGHVANHVSDTCLDYGALFYRNQPLFWLHAPVCNGLEYFYTRQWMAIRFNGIS